VVPSRDIFHGGLDGEVDGGVRHNSGGVVRDVVEGGAAADWGITATWTEVVT
jgi:hypothetical protein